MKFDLTTRQGVVDYLSYSSSDPLARFKPSAKGVEALSGGNTNYVWRIWLEVPLSLGEDKKDVVQTVVLKHGKPLSRSWDEVMFSTKRQTYEVEMIRRVGAWHRSEGQRPIVTVPIVYHFDEEACAIIMEDAGEKSVTLKAFMQQPGVTEEMAREIGRGTGKFLGSLHAWGTSQGEVMDLAREHVEARKISAWYYYGQYEVGVTNVAKIPQMGLPSEDMERIREIGRETQEAMVNATDSFVQGDFWPGNMLVKLDESGKLQRILVVDWEVTKTGITSIEVGQFAAEMHLLRICIPGCAKTAPVVLQNYLEAYGPLSDEEKERMMRHIGTHMILLADIWASDTEAIVSEGLRILLNKDGGVSRGRVLQ